MREFSPPLDFLQILLRVRSDLRFGSRRDEELMDEDPVLAVLIVASHKVCVLFLRPPALVCPLFPSRRWDQARNARRRKRSKQHALLGVFMARHGRPHGAPRWAMVYFHGIVEGRDAMGM